LGRHSAPVTWGGVGTDAQHAVFQLLHQGTHLIPVEFIAKQLSSTKKLIVIEEGSGYSSYSSELIAALSEVMDESFKVRRIAGLPVPIPSVKSLEDQVLPSKDRIINEIKSTFN
jgi:pyruvate/2-oxoglutarate/acetoin dehydrogenase E1 component